MVNTNIQAPIPLDGLGFVAKLKRDYNPGEYRRLSNVEIVDGIIKNRRTVSAIANQGTVTNPLVNSFPFLGFIDQYAIYCSKTVQRATSGGSGYQTLWAPTSLPVPVAANSFHRIVGAYRYNNLNCWLTHKYDAATGANEIWLYKAPNNALAQLSDITFASLTATLLISDLSFDFVYDNFFIQGERLWIVTSKAIYFSKATDHTIWGVPDGGFFKFQSQVIHFAMFLKDTIFVLCDNSVFSINYSTNPNTDAFARQLSDVVGGDHGCVHLDTAYFINASGVYAVYATGIEKVMDNFFDVGTSSAYTNKLTSFEDYLIVNKYNPRNYDDVSSFGPAYFGNVGRYFSPGASFNLLGHNVFFVNTVTGATHVLDFKDSLDTAENGYIVDVIVNPNKDFFRDFYCFFMTNKFISKVGSTYTYNSNIYKMKTSYNTFIWDEACDSAGVVQRYKPAIDIEIDSFSPDGNEYLIKKFRSLELMAELPTTDFGVKFAFDNQDFPASDIALNIDTNAIDAAGEPRTPYPCRVGMNQRARSLSVKFQTKNNNTPLAMSAVYSNFQLSDARLLWTYTSRGTNLRTPTTP